MIKIQFEEPSSEEWSMWKARCQKATGIIIEDRSKCIVKKLDKSLYKEMKEVYFSEEGPFRGKCAYCESFIASDQPGDLDHYRPKAKVKDEHDQLVEILDNQGKKSPHPGYYWLAYDWRNLLPCCRDCNSPSKRKTKGNLVGKGYKFPVIGSHAVCPGKEADEQPLLINPMVEDPSDHLEIDSTGIAIWKTKRGEVSIDIFGLNKREALVRMRKEVFEAASEAMLTLFDASRPIEPESTSLNSTPKTPEKKERVLRCIEKLEAFKSGRAAYSAAGRAGIDSEFSACYDTASWLCIIYGSLCNSNSNAENILGSACQDTNHSNE